MAYSGKLDEPGSWPPLDHRLSNVTREDVRLFPAKEQGGTAGGVPERPEVDVAERARLVGTAEARIVIEAEAAVGPLAGAVDRQFAPLGVRQPTKRARCLRTTASIASIESKVGSAPR